MQLHASPAKPFHFLIRHAMKIARLFAFCAALGFPTGVGTAADPVEQAAPPATTTASDEAANGAGSGDDEEKPS
jgi:hypothetical protein